MGGRLAAIDAGSNAIRVVIAELSSTDLVRVEAERVPVRLGHHAFTHGELDARVIDQAVAAFVRFRERFDQHGVTMYRAVATSAVRDRLTEAGPETTLWEQASEYRFSSLLMRLMGLLMPGAFHKQSQQHMQDFKEFAEQGKDVRDGKD